MKKIFLCFMSIGLFSVQAQTIHVACGPNQKDSAIAALKENDPTKANVYLVFELEGSNNPPKIITLTDQTKIVEPAKLYIRKYAFDDDSTQLTLQLRDYTKYEFSLKDCNNLGSSSGVLGFFGKYNSWYTSGYGEIKYKKCNCKTVE